MSVVSLSDLTLQQVESTFINSDFFKAKNVNPLLSDIVVANVFFEPSTRTRMSFEMATLRLGAKSILFNGKIGTSLEKEETLSDTVLNIAAMKPDIMVIRCGDDLNLRAVQKDIDIPIINAGWGTQGHPTQALLDIATLRSKGRNTAHERILFVGDIKHSRVVASHRELAAVLKYEIAFCGPTSLMPMDSKVPIFKSLSEGLAWATTVIFLRFQKERHQLGGAHAEGGSLQEVNHSPKPSEFQLNKETLKLLKNDAYFMHPGPVNWGVEMTNDVLNDSRCLILNQVNHGVYMRMALIYLVSKREL